QSGAFRSNTESFSYDAERLEIGEGSYFYEKEYESDFADIKGQKVAKRASLIAAAGMHNFMMEGSPGCGKSMIAKRLRDILPPVYEEEILSIAKHQFLDGVTPDFSAHRPIRAPHHTATTASIFGGGSQQARIGEVALAHKGILFFDELPHFSKNILEALREPLHHSLYSSCESAPPALPKLRPAKSPSLPRAVRHRGLCVGYVSILLLLENLRSSLSLLLFS
ncbi:MAG TPA: hypothetical protein ENK71_00190, partial [Epsilonproteobacteria bacterium]|nr:hypothetical protein [Campylobacterota bacterium]